MLGHLSKESNFPELAYKTVVETLMSSKHYDNPFSLSVAKRDEQSQIVTI